MTNIPTSNQQINNEDSMIDMMNNIAIGGGQNHINIYKNSDFKPKLENIEFNLPKLIHTFRGRTNEMTQLNSWLFEQKKTMVTICGLPGFGKTELCKQYVRQLKDTNKIKNICWIQAENLEQSLKDLSKSLNLPNVAGRALIQIISKYFQGSHTAFIFDNAENRQSLLEFETPNNCYCLINSHEKDWGDDIPSLQLLELEPNASVDILYSVLIHVHDKNDELYNNLASILGHIPLALQIAAACIREEKKELRDNFHLEQYVEELENSEEEFVDKSVPKCSTLPYEKSIQKAINTSLQKIKKHNSFKSNLAIDILNIFSYLNPYETWETTFLKFSYIQKLLQNMKKPGNEIRRALNLLDNYSFVHYSDDGSVKIHALVQKTLLFFQYHHSNKVNIYFDTCLEHILSSSCQHHFYGIAKYIERNFELFPKMYAKHKSNIFSMKYNYKAHNWQYVLRHFESSLLHGNLDYNTSFLGVLVSMGFQKCLTYVLEDLGKNVSEKINENFLLHEAILYNQPELLKLLISYGADINKRNSRDLLPLHIAAIELNLECIKILLENNAEINDTNSINSVLFNVIVGSGWIVHNDKENNIIFDILNILLKNGASIVNNKNDTILHLAGMLEKLNVKVIEYLIDVLLIDINAQNVMGETVLHKVIVNTGTYTEKQITPAIKEMRVMVVKSLMERGARLDLRNDKLLSPLDLVIMYNVEDVLEVFKSYEK